MFKKMIYSGAALFFFFSGCAATLFFMQGPELISIAQAGGCYTILRNTSTSVSGNQGIYTFQFDRNIVNVSVNGAQASLYFDNQCPYNCQRFNPASGTCIGPGHNWCDAK